ncbi:putative transcription factor GAGA-Binding-like family [Helianthus annuus]|nr:putative transcription factor GAGA-Binding-like family [Helianthus annuus]KAJ0462526.1 putative transcription factor GAGA-Binding-like family [Helianthus annuus]KAJ0838265.1 putative transcription factor GAGA-Binding-like family [Helianthus annuus]
MDHNHFTIKTFMAIMAERDAAIQERNLALEERKRAFAERDMAMLQRDAALAERNTAMQERDEAISTIRFRSNFINENMISTTSEPPENIQNHGSKRGFNDEEMHHMFEIPEDYQLPPPENTKPRKVPKKTKSQSPHVGSKRADVTNVNSDYEESSSDAQLEAWKDELGLNQVNFDETAMPVPVCSCTGVPQPCYRWGSGGWQSACCTTTMSMYPLPLVTNKRYSRVGGRKMSGGAFTKLLTRLASEGYDLSTPLDLKDHWAKHGTNRYSKLK